MNEEWKKIFAFTKNERRAISIILGLIIITILFYILKPQIKTLAIDFSSFKSQIIEYNKTQDSLKNIKTEPQNIDCKSKYNLKYFNPNKISKEDWVSLGLSEKQAATILKFIEKGGRFKSPEDLKKIYCLSNQKCEELIPFVNIETELNDNNFNQPKNIVSSKEIKILDLNSATVEQLIEIPGIGPSTANGILKLKELLGGYYNVSQLLEVYQIDDVKYKQIKSYFTVNQSFISKININNSDYYRLKKHPYISKRVAYEIVQARELKGNYKKIEELKTVTGINDSIYNKISPYLTVN